MSCALLWNELKDICIDALQCLATEVTARWPNVKSFVDYHMTNPVFPLMAGVSFLLRADGDSVDVSINFKWGKGAVEVTVDIFSGDETGTVLAELPCQMIPLTDTGELVESEALEIVRKVAAYVKGQSLIVCNAVGELVNGEEGTR